jgi:hypothetical protein
MRQANKKISGYWDFRTEKRPRIRGLFILISILDDGLTAHAVIVILLDHRGALSGLAFFDHRCAFTIAIPVEVPVAFTRSYAGTDRADPNADFVRYGADLFA